MFITRIYYMTYILYRGLKYDLNLLVADLKVLFDTILTQLAALIRIPLFNTIVLYITLAFRLLMEYLSSIDLSFILNSVNISCQGSQVNLTSSVLTILIYIY